MQINQIITDNDKRLLSLNAAKVRAHVCAPLIGYSSPMRN